MTNIAKNYQTIIKVFDITRLVISLNKKIYHLCLWATQKDHQQATLLF